MNPPSDKACGWAQGIAGWPFYFFFFLAHLFIFTEMTAICVYLGSALMSARAVEEASPNIGAQTVKSSLGSYQGSAMGIGLFSFLIIHSWYKKWMKAYPFKDRNLHSTLKHCGTFTEKFNIGRRVSYKEVSKKYKYYLWRHTWKHYPWSKIHNIVVDKTIALDTKLPSASAKVEIVIVLSELLRRLSEWTNERANLWYRLSAQSVFIPWHSS